MKTTATNDVLKIIIFTNCHKRTYAYVRTYLCLAVGDHDTTNNNSHKSDSAFAVG